MDENRADALIRTIGLREFTEKSIIDFSRYKKEVSEARSSGYGLDDEEYIPGVRAVAAVIHSPTETMSAVWVVGFTPSMGAERMFDIAMETKRAADSCEVLGWVRNRRDGTVEAVFEGRREDVDAALNWCRQGPRMSRVDKVDVTWQAYTGEFDRFDVTY